MHPLSVESTCYSRVSSIKSSHLGDHALIGVSTFNSYFSVENMEKLFLWAHKNFTHFNVFFMDGASIFNLMAVGYHEQEALRKTKKHDRNIENKIIKSLVNIGFDMETSKEKIVLLSTLSKNKKYSDLHEKYVNLFEENILFRNDCLNATNEMLSSKVQEISNDSLYLAVKYLLAELPLWFEAPFILNLNSSTFIYKDLSYFWKKICYDYNLLSSTQKILVKSVLD